MKEVQAGFIEIYDDLPYKMIERAGRVCYKSEDLIKEGSDITFTKKIMSFNHGSVLEHAYVVLEVTSLNLFHQMKIDAPKFLNFSEGSKLLVSGNFRAFYELYQNFKNDVYYPLYAYLEYLFPEVYPSTYQEYFRGHLFKKLTKEEISSLPSEEKDVHLSITILFTTDRGVSHELVRHRIASFAQESTRYCNYAKDKFHHEISFIKPLGINENQYPIWKKAMEEAEASYFTLLENGAKPDLARSVLPNSLKTEIVVSCVLKEWKHIFALRTASNAHIDIRTLMISLEAYFKEKHYL